MFQVNPLLGRGFTLNIKPYFLTKIKVKKIKCCLLQFLFGTLRVKLYTTVLFQYFNDFLILIKSQLVLPIIKLVPVSEKKVMNKIYSFI